MDKIHSMTDKQMAELLHMFHEIEELMVQNGAKETSQNGDYTSFKEKLNSFDTFEFEPKNPGNVGYKFYVEEGLYKTKEAYRYDVNIKEQLDIYGKYKSYERRYLEYRTTILGGNYYVLKKIGYIRNKLLYIENYEIKEHKSFVKDCHSMMKYLKNPNNKPFVTHGKFTNRAKDKLMKLKIHSAKTDLFDKGLGNFILKTFIFLSILTTIILVLRYFNSKNVPSLSDSNTSPYILWSIFTIIALYMLSRLLEFLTTHTWVVRVILFIASLFGLNYLKDNGFLPLEYSNYNLTIGEYLFVGAFLVLLIYLLPSFIRGVSNFISAFLTGLFSLFFSKNSIIQMLVSIVPYIFLVWFMGYLMIYGKAIREDIFPKEADTQSVLSKRIVNKGCQYYYVNVDTLHVRAYATDRSRIIGKVYKNEKLCITKKESHWYYVRYKGWVFLQHLTKKR